MKKEDRKIIYWFLFCLLTSCKTSSSLKIIDEVKKEQQVTIEKQKIITKKTEEVKEKVIQQCPILKNDINELQMITAQQTIRIDNQLQFMNMLEYQMQSEIENYKMQIKLGKTTFFSFIVVLLLLNYIVFKVLKKPL